MTDIVVLNIFFAHTLFLCSNRARGIKLHAANSAGTLLGYGTDLDFVRPGIAMYGLPPG